jgi:putative ATPase
MEAPLAERLRPQNFEEVVGQPHLIGEKGFLTQVIKSGKPISIILWSPPGTGKTSIARLYAKAFSIPFKALSAIFSGVADLKQIVKEIEANPIFGHRLVLFVDEIHRFNKAQQDAFLPLIEKGTIILVGATAENPSFYLNDALLSRVTVLKLNPLTTAALSELLGKYEEKVHPLPLTPDSKKLLLELAQGDGRYLFNLIEGLEKLPIKEPLAPKEMLELLQQRAPSYDKDGDRHYDLISALHKSVRGSDPDAALYWLARMLEGGEDPLFLARRIIRMASEDVGQADPSALPLAVAAYQSYQMLGSPEGELMLAQAVVYLALAPKSNATYTALGAARESAKATTHLHPPLTIVNAPTRLMKNLGHGDGYIYDPDTPEGFSGQNYFPQEMERPTFYSPVKRGFEREMKKRLDYFTRLREKMGDSHNTL